MGLGLPPTGRPGEPPLDASALVDVELSDAAGNPVRLGDVWRRRPAVFVFLRHFG